MKTASYLSLPNKRTNRWLPVFCFSFSSFLETADVFCHIFLLVSGVRSPWDTGFFFLALKFYYGLVIGAITGLVKIFIICMTRCILGNLVLFLEFGFYYFAWLVYFQIYFFGFLYPWTCIFLILQVVYA